MKHLKLTVPAAALAFAAAANGAVIRVDMQPSTAFSGNAPVNFSGVESQAAAADSQFGSDGANIWNYLTEAPNTGVYSASFDGLVDSTGAATSVNLSLNSANGFFAADDTPIDNSGSDGVENDYFGIISSTVNYTISGLPADTEVALYLYAPNFTHFDSGDPTDQPSRGYQLTANGAAITVNSGSSNNALAFVTTDASGDISGVWSAPNGNEGDWSGFQLAFSSSPDAPEPSTGALIATGLVVLPLSAARGRRRRRPAAAMPPDRPQP
jgi:hypothetical protein